MNITQDPRSFSFPQRTLIGTTKSSKLYRLDNSVSMLTLWFLWSLFMKYSLKMIWEKKENDEANVVLGNLGEGYSGILCTILAILLWIWKIMFIKILKTHKSGTSLVVQWLGLSAPNAEGPGSVPGQETRSHMPQLRLCMLQLRPDTANWINKNKYFLKSKQKNKNTQNTIWINIYIIYIHIYIERDECEEHKILQFYP